MIGKYHLGVPEESQLGFDYWVTFATGHTTSFHGVEVIDNGETYVLEDEHLTVRSFLNKQVPEQAALYDDLWRTSAFLFMPTRADTFGAVYCEAAAKGVPAIATDTGGVGDAVADGVSGRLLALDAGSAEYADVIEAICADKASYLYLVSGARRRFESDLNWNVWGDRTAALVADLLGVDDSSAE